MKRTWLAVVAVLIVSLPVPTATAAAQAAGKGSGAHASGAPLAFKGVTVIDVMDGRRLPDQTVVVAGNRIQAVGTASQVQVPAGTQVVDARGKYLTPGFWDMHPHVDDLADEVYPEFIANGITGLREMAQRFPDGPAVFLQRQHEIMAGTRVGPRVVGPSADLTYGMQIETPEDARRIMDSLKAAKVAFIKFHDSGMEPDLYFAIAREARRVGIPMVGHVPRSVMNADASDSGGLASVEHIEENHQCWPGWPGVLLGDSVEAEQRCAPMVQAYIRNGTWMMIGLNSHWLDDQYRPDKTEGLWEEMKRFVRMLHRLGMRKFLAGTDWSPIFVAWDERFRPGLSAAEEMVAYFEGGLTPLEALQTGTLNPAVFFHATDSLGTVAPGKLADLVLLDGDPLVDIHNVLKVQAVVANGRYFDRATLNTMDPEGIRLGGLVAAREHGATPMKAKAGTP